ncbi:MAG: DUF3488 and DUF4129 domain-containing transglutaminase family protein [Burkholderiales bacterium]|nr:DUF3488 and DUF4129 domain-containing transglutaminase family protein [Burkholderiales bacterium]
MPRLPAPSLYLLFAGIAIATVPHLPRLPAWISALAVGLLAWRAWVVRRRIALPRKWLVIGLAATSLVMVYLHYKTLFGRDAGVALLVVFLALKLLEMKSLRDVTVVVLLAYFLALTNFFYSQTILVAAVMTGALVVLTAALVGCNAPRRALGANVRTAAALLAQGLPVMLVLFLLFPRVQGPLWGMPQDAFAGMTGLSDSMTPGNISLLSQSDAIAFRAKFEGDPPPRGALYWRGPVFWEFDGRTWRGGRGPSSQFYRFEPEGSPVKYEVTVEPHNRQWLFALDLAGQVPPNAFGTADYQLISRAPVRHRIRYPMHSFLQYRAIAAAMPAELDYARELPAGANPRTRELARRWRVESGGDGEAIVARAIDHFRNAGLRYTIAPPLLGENPVDEVLFVTKQGFCEHFSSAFAFLMRAAGVPARIVTGYQGGELNPVDQFLVVRQSDAHAWVEVWLPARGWVRVDPTAVVVPLRVESGLAAAVPETGALPLLVRVDVPWLRELRFGWEALANRWNQWVLGYNPERQREFLTRLGMPSADWHELATTLFWAVGGLVLLIALFVLRRRLARDPVQRVWLAFCAKLARAGTERRPSEGPAAFAERAAREHPEQAGTVAAIARLYADLRYGPSPAPEGVGELARRVREFRP